MLLCEWRSKNFAKSILNFDLIKKNITANLFIKSFNSNFSTSHDLKKDILNKIKVISFRIGKYLDKRIRNHLLSLKYLNKAEGKMQWLNKAFKKKLEREKNLSANDFISSDSYLGCKIDRELDLEIKKSVDIIKNYRVSYSKKQWILEAIEELLEIEEREAVLEGRDRLEKMIKQSSLEEKQPLESV